MSAEVGGSTSTHYAKQQYWLAWGCWLLLVILTVLIGGNWLLAASENRNTPTEESNSKIQGKAPYSRGTNCKVHFGLAIPSH